MRKIKFRAWDKNKKVMLADYSSLGFTVEIMDGDFIVRNGEIATELGGKERFSLMQYTGLKDKNGVEIYEGDIMDGYAGKQQVIWSEDVGIGFGFCWKPIRDYSESITGFIDEYKVIGNIYENPDLINQPEL